MEETEARVHHAEPLIVSGEICSEGPNGFPQPFLDGWAVDVVVVDPVFVAGIVGRIDEDAFDSAGVVGEECFEREEVIAFNEEVASTEGFVLNPEGSTAVVGECMYWHFIVMVDDSFFADPIERWHVRDFLASPSDAGRGGVLPAQLGSGFIYKGGALSPRVLRAVCVTTLVYFRDFSTLLQ